MTRLKMTRWLMAGALATGTLSGCQTGDTTPAPTSATEQLSTGSFCYATLPPIVTYVPGQTVIPVAPSLTTSGYVVFQDWVHGGFLAALVDISQGKVLNAFAVSNQNVALFMYYQTFRGRITVPNTPPGPHPGGNEGLARYSLELELLISDTSKQAEANANSCP